MNGKQTSIAQDLELLFKKTVEANQQFISEGARFVKNLSASNLKGEDFVSGQKELISDAFNQFVKLNIQHASNLVDLGIALSQKMGGHFEPTTGGAGKSNGAGTPDEPTPGEPGKPAFVLNISGAPGARITTQFLLDSDKKDAVSCRLLLTGYRRQDTSEEVAFETIFSPPSFQLLPGGQPQKVTIAIQLPDETREGLYLSNVLVEGYENTFFSLYVKVLPSSDPSTKMSA